MQPPSEQEIRAELHLSRGYYHLFINNYHGPELCPECIRKGAGNAIQALINQAADKREQEVLERVHCCDNVPEAGYDNAINVCSSDHITRLIQLRQAAEGE